MAYLAAENDAKTVMPTAPLALALHVCVYVCVCVCVPIGVGCSSWKGVCGQAKSTSVAFANESVDMEIPLSLHPCPTKNRHPSQGTYCLLPVTSQVHGPGQVPCSTSWLKTGQEWPTSPLATTSQLYWAMVDEYDASAAAAAAAASGQAGSPDWWHLRKIK
ncbi:hypothetical protein LZ32DRAFT_383056 [Colletotrichum eremochloae]|nr:hypothetical protein LZ32DRAFT_383056 [Colletotrichum eremochloae]